MMLLYLPSSTSQPCSTTTWTRWARRLHDELCAFWSRNVPMSHIVPPSLPPHVSCCTTWVKKMHIMSCVPCLSENSPKMHSFCNFSITHYVITHYVILMLLMVLFGQIQRQIPDPNKDIPWCHKIHAKGTGQEACGELHNLIVEYRVPVMSDCKFFRFY